MKITFSLAIAISIHNLLFVLKSVIVYEVINLRASTFQNFPWGACPQLCVHIAGQLCGFMMSYINCNTVNGKISDSSEAYPGCNNYAEQPLGIHYTNKKIWLYYAPLIDDLYTIAFIH